MWVAKIIVPGNSGMLLASLAKKHKVTLMGYPLSNYFSKKKLFLLASVNLIGEPKAKEEFLQDIKKDPRAIKVDMMNDSFGIFLMEQHPSISVMYDPLIIHVKPLVVSKDGDNIWEIASWDRDKLIRIGKLVHTGLYGGKLVSLCRRKLDDITMVTLLPRITSKQRRALELALENGYYAYPRNIEAQQLAKIMKVSTSTYQFHLRNAEKKILPYVHKLAVK
jgi:predicted DNA binding protein